VRGNINITFPGVDARALLMRLDMLGIAASAGSACTSGAAEPSHVLTAIGLDAQAAGGTLRLSLSDESTPEEADEVIRVLCELIPRPGGHGTA
jgi:cysteine desulfurase